MNVSWQWLRAVASTIEETPEALAEALALRGAPVEGIQALAEGLEGVRVGRVEAVEAHPDADRLRVCRVVAAPGEEPRPVVCGAPNVVAGGLYPFAPEGATLPGGMRIEVARIRGQESRGMLCSGRELGLDADQSGLMELPAGLEPGMSLVDALGLRDWRLDVEVTANRGDLLSHVGVAREAAPGGQDDVRLPEIPGGEEPELELIQDRQEASTGSVTVRIDDPELCPRYLGAVIRGVQVGPSPRWLQARLRAAGARPVNNVVDATNYVMLELGQPLHAFDLALLAEDAIVVRRPREGERRFTTLDGEERTLERDMLLICDAREPVAVAGVMGGLESEVTEGTTDILLECALFDPASIRATRRALNLSTDASYRFERGVDPAGMEAALRRAVQVIRATAGGTVETRVADCVPGPWEAPVVDLRVARVEHVLGVRLPASRIRELLEPLGFRFVGENDGVLEVEIPGWRSYDVTREVDLIEEVARTHGYDAFPEELGSFRPGSVPDHPLFGLEDDLRDLLVARGFFEAQTPAFVPGEEGEVRVVNPVSKEEDHLRRSLMPGLLRRVEHNWARGMRDVRLFEIGTCFRSGGPGRRPHEATRLGLVLTGRAAPVHWSGEERGLDLWDLKALVESLVVAARRGAVLEVGAPDQALLVAAEALTVREHDGRAVGWAGLVHPRALDAPAWADPVYGLELTLPPEPASVPPPDHHPLPPFPGVERDLALLVPDGLPAERIREAVVASGGPYLEEVVLFDRYVGQGVPEGMRSLAWRMRFQSRERTLTDQDVETATAGVVQHLRSELGVEPRG